jgi:FixJ family two-component response regulator
MHHTQPNVYANTINRANTNSSKSNAPKRPFNHLHMTASLVHATIVAGAIAKVLCQALGLSRSTTNMQALVAAHAMHTMRIA